MEATHHSTTDVNGFHSWGITLFFLVWEGFQVLALVLYMVCTGLRRIPDDVGVHAKKDTWGST